MATINFNTLFILFIPHAIIIIMEQACEPRGGNSMAELKRLSLLCNAWLWIPRGAMSSWKFFCAGMTPKARTQQRRPSARMTHKTFMKLSLTFAHRFCRISRDLTFGSENPIDPSHQPSHDR